MNDQEWSDTVLRDGLDRIAEWCAPSAPEMTSLPGVSVVRAASAGPRWTRLWLAAAAIVVIGATGLVWATFARDGGSPTLPVPVTQPPETATTTPADITAPDVLPRPAPTIEALIAGLDTEVNLVRRVDVRGVVDHYGIVPEDLRTDLANQTAESALAWEVISQSAVPFRFGDHRDAIDPAALATTLSTARGFGDRDALVIAGTSQDPDEIIGAYLYAGWEQLDAATLQAPEYVGDPDLPPMIAELEGPAAYYPVVHVDDQRVVLAADTTVLDRYLTASGPSDELRTMLDATADDLVVEIHLGQAEPSDSWTHPVTTFDCVAAVASSYRDGEFALTVLDGGQGVLTGLRAELSGFELGEGASVPPVSRYPLTNPLDHRIDALFNLILGPDSDLLFDVEC